MTSGNSNELIIKSNTFNALFLEFLKQLFLNLIFFLPLFLVYLVFEYVLDLDFRNTAILSLIGITLLYSLYKISYELFIIKITKYIFTPYTIEKRSGLFTTTSHSLNYSQITDIELNMTFWDKLCNVGDLIIHTANDSVISKKIKASMVLRDIKNPLKLKQEMLLKVNAKNHHPIHHKIHQESTQTHQ